MSPEQSVNHVSGTGQGSVARILLESDAATLLAADGATLRSGNMTYQGGTLYKKIFWRVSVPPDPASVTVTSSGGGSDTVTLPFP